MYCIIDCAVNHTCCRAHADARAARKAEDKAASRRASDLWDATTKCAAAQLKLEESRRHGADARKLEDQAQREVDEAPEQREHKNAMAAPHLSAAKEQGKM